MANYTCTDGNADIEIEADSAREAAQEYVDGGDWGEITETTWITVHCTDEDDETESHKIAIDPDEPDCTESEHNWQAPYSVLGGLQDNPGVQGHGGGVTLKRVCAHCGKYRLTDSWAQDPSDGEQGLDSTRYEDADDRSEAWVTALSAGEEDE